MASGYFVLEGCDAAGKSTQIRLLAALLEARGYAVTVVREPGGTRLGDRIRAMLLARDDDERVEPFTSLLLFNASRCQLIEGIVKPALREGRIVLSDRSFISTLAYQACAEGVDPLFARELCLRAIGGAMPDKVFFLDISVEETGRRIAASRGTCEEKDSRYDLRAAAFHAKVREGYRAQAAAFPGLIETIDGHAPVGEVTRMLSAAILAHVTKTAFP